MYCLAACVCRFAAIQETQVYARIWGQGTVTERELGIDARVEKSRKFEQKWVFMPGTKSKQVCVCTDQKPRASLKTWLSEPTWVRVQYTSSDTFATYRILVALHFWALTHKLQRYAC